MTRFISWNVNGIRSVLKKGLHDFIKAHRPDILCLQETKAHSSQVDFSLPGVEAYWNSPALRRGYSGTAIFTKLKPRNAVYGMEISKHDQEGRVITAEYDDFFLVNVYVPNSKRDLSRLDYRQKWDSDFLKYLKKLEKKKPVIFCGDMNVAHQEIDLTNPSSNRRNHGFTEEERSGFDQILKAGFVDTFREFTKEGGHYTWWSRLHDCRTRNIGWRIDYFCVSKSLRPRLKKAFILPKVMGSDHCPVAMTLD